MTEIKIFSQKKVTGKRNNIPISRSMLNYLSIFLSLNTKAIYYLCIHLSILNVIGQNSIG
jgi:hypothetical protein